MTRRTSAIIQLQELSITVDVDEKMKPLKKASEMTVKELGSYIDQSVLKPEFSEDDIRKYIQEGIDYGCRTVCINPSSLDIAAELTKGTDTKICVVCDFPFGTSTTESKVAQAELYCKRGDVFELDIVANYGWILSGKWDDVTADIKAVVDVCHKYDVAVKVIFETDTLNEEQVRKSCQCAIVAGADFVKTSTGFLTGFEAYGATPEVIKIMLEECEGKAKVKGSGCIRTREHFLQLIDMGIDRMGVGYRSTPVVLGITEDASVDKNSTY
ncbi:deoxyribose-phosphate aldolase [Alkalibaculum bacchi]|uniref:Deoxyribose-phosphate aldolase n=2 Tax=Alkalibaculum bacchi TaxID=645887 RepID=A0A366I5K2_9FIRM|nr:deoxyribose-phosphate aldolase [Alkalibaculum bacchi]